MPAVLSTGGMIVLKSIRPMRSILRATLMDQMMEYLRNSLGTTFIYSPDSTDTANLVDQHPQILLSDSIHVRIHSRWIVLCRLLPLPRPSSPLQSNWQFPLQRFMLCCAFLPNPHRYSHDVSDWFLISLFFYAIRNILPPKLKFTSDENPLHQRRICSRPAQLSLHR